MGSSTRSRPGATRLLLLLAIVGIGIAAASVPAAPPALAAPGRTEDPARILFVGASVTHGLYSTGANDAYPAALDRLLDRQGTPVRPTVVAHPGARVAEAAAWTLPAGQAVVVLHLVTNDFRRSTPLTPYRASYDRLLDRVKRASPQARLACLGDWGPPVARNRIGAAAVDYDAVIHAACQDRGGVFVPLSQLYANPHNRGPAGRPTPFGRSDPFHPNDTGQLAIAEAVQAGLAGDPPQEQLPSVPRSGVPLTPGPPQRQRPAEGRAGPPTTPTPSAPPPASAVAARR